MGKIKAPEPLTPMHNVSSFNCGAPGLNDWLQKQAYKNEVTGASRTYVVCRNDRVTGFYALATGSVHRSEATGNIKREMPDPIPIIILGRLAVDREMQGKGIGSGLLKDAVLRTLRIAEEVGVRALLVHALNDQAVNFYLSHGFRKTPMDAMTLMLNISSYK